MVTIPNSPVRLWARFAERRIERASRSSQVFRGKVKRTAWLAGKCSASARRLRVRLASGPARLHRAVRAAASPSQPQTQQAGQPEADNDDEHKRMGDDADTNAAAFGVP